MSFIDKNILITGAGGAAVPGLIKRLKSSGYRVIAADCDATAAGFYYADKGFVIPEGAAAEFFDSILEVCRKEKIDAIIPLVDEELIKASELEKHGIAVILPGKEFITTCLDKYLLIKRLDECGIPCLKTRLADEGAEGMDFPLILKPRTGRGSRGVEVVYSKERIDAILTGVKRDKFILQEYVDGPEFTVSVVLWRDGEVRAVVPKEIISKKGITKVAVTRKHPKIDELCRKVQKELKADGPFNVQLRFDPVRELPFIFEINPRFSTSISLTIGAGIDELCGILELALRGKENYRFGDWKEGVVLLRQTLDELVDEKEYAAHYSMVEKLETLKGGQMDKIETVLEIEKHPFFVGPVTPEKALDLPKSLPFKLGVHPRYAIPRLIMDSNLTSALEKAYSIGSMASTPLGESDLSTIRMKEFFNKLLSLFNGDLKGRKLLEIGSGSGALLNELAKLGAEVTGLEIGPQGMESAKKYGFRVIDKRFKKGLLNEKFDCIYSYACVEHIIEIDDFFEASRDCLNEKGLFFHLVPNSGLYFNTVILNHLVHEHINYFTAFSGCNLFSAQGFRSVKSALSSAGNELMLWGYYDSSIKPRWPAEFVHKEKEGLKAYAEKLAKKTDRIVNALKGMISEGRTIGFYAGGFEYGVLLNEPSIRYFDGDSFKHGKSWLGGLPPIESPASLKGSPVDNLIICREHYFEQIVKHLTAVGISSKTKILNIELLGLD